MNYLINNTLNLPDVLLDLSMPYKKFGFECLIEIKENKKLASLPVIILLHHSVWIKATNVI